MRKFIKSRCIFFYILLGVIFYFTVNREAATINRLNSLKEVERHLYNFSVGDEPFDAEQFLWGARYFKELIKINPNNAALYGNLGFCYYYLGDHHKAIEAYKKALSLDSKLYTHHYDLGMIYFYANDFKNATEHLQATINQIPPTVKYYLRLGQRLQENGKDELSRGIHHLLSKAQEDESKAYEYLIKCFFYNREYDIMREVALLGFKSQPDHEPIVYFLGLSNYLLKDYEKAIPYFDKAVLLDPEDTSAYYYRGLCMDKLNRQREYFRDVQKVLGLKNLGAKAHENGPIKLHITSDLQVLELMVTK